jgi:hypothetical protein
MGEGYIVSGGPRGLYKVRIVKHAGLSTERLKTIDQLLINIDVMLQRLEDDDNSLRLALEAAQSAYASVAEQYMKGEVSSSDVVSKKTAVIQAQTDLRNNKTEQAYLKIQKIALLKEKKRLEDAMEPVEKSLWCVDYTDNLPAEKKVGILECDADFQWMNIEGGGNNKMATGLMQPAAVSSPSGVFYNLALMPCKQRHRPTFRSGWISNIDYETSTATVTLDNPNYSSATMICREHNQIPINRYTNNPATPGQGQTVMHKVPIEYMGYNADSFLNGDHVIVRFKDNDWFKPVVIGFHDNPREVLDLMQCRFDNVAASEELIDEIEYMITEVTTYKDHFIMYKDVFCPEVIGVIQFLLGKLRGWDAVLME